jgi:hypothetical protein
MMDYILSFSAETTVSSSIEVMHGIVFGSRPHTDADLRSHEYVAEMAVETETIE